MKARLRGSAWAFERAAGEYGRARPGFPAAVTRHVAAVLGLAPHSRVIEVGAGTGKFTAALAGTGLRPVATEPLAGMLAVLRAGLPRVPAVRSVAERMPFGAASADAVAAAGAFHWFDPARALAEFRRVLRPGGGLALLWQVRGEAAWPWDGIGPILDRHRGAHPTSRQIVAGVGDLPGFGRPARASFPNLEVRSPAEVVERVLSISFVAALPVDERRAVAEEVAAILATRPGPVALDYDVVVFTARRS